MINLTDKIEEQVWDPVELRTWDHPWIQPHNQVLRQIEAQLREELEYGQKA